MFIKKWVVLCLILGSAQGVLFAATYQDISELGTSAGMIGRGNVGGFSGAACGLLENPVGMSHAGNSVSTFYTQLFGDIDYVTGAVSYQVTPEITLGVGAIVEVNPNNDITSTNDANEVISEGTFIAYTSQSILGADFKLAKDLNLGITWTQYTRKQSDLEGSGGDLGLGVRYAHTSGEFLVYGKNILGKSMTYNTDTSEKFAPETGMAYKSPPIQELHNSEIFGQVLYLSDANILLKGVGIRVYPLDNPYLGLTLGYKDKQQAGSAMRSLLSAGVSLSLGNLRFDYAYDTTDVYQQENQHYFSMSLHFPISHAVAISPSISPDVAPPAMRTQSKQEAVKTITPPVSVVPAPVATVVQTPDPIVSESEAISEPLSHPIPSQPLIPPQPETFVSKSEDSSTVSVLSPPKVKTIEAHPRVQTVKNSKPLVQTPPEVPPQDTSVMTQIPTPTQVSDIVPPPNPSILQQLGAVLISVGATLWHVLRSLLGWFF